MCKIFAQIRLDSLYIYSMANLKFRHAKVLLFDNH